MNISTNLKYKRLLYTLGGIIAFYMTARYARIPTGTKGVYVFLQYWILVYIAARFGPVCGAVTGFFGHFLFEYTKTDSIKWSWIIGSMILGILIGVLVKRYNIDISSIPKKEDRTKFALVNVFSQVIVWCIIVPILNMTIYDMAFSDAIKRGIFAAINDIVTSVIWLDLFLYSYGKAKVKKMVSLFVIVNSIILLSYGNFGLGSICVYSITIIISCYVYAKSILRPITPGKIRRVARPLLLICGSVLLVSFVTLHFVAKIDAPKGSEKCMIILGAGLKQEKPSKILKKRLDKALDYIEEYPDITIIASGGQGSDECISEAAAMKLYLVNHGCSPESIYIEDTSTTTEENFANSLEIMKELGFNEDTPTIYVTNDFHCYRAKGYAKMAGIKYPHPLSSPTPVFLILSSYFKESFSLVKYVLKYIMS